VSLQIASEEVGPLKVLAYLLSCPATGEALLIDPAGPAPKLAAHIREAGLQVRWLVNTHGHADHTAGNELWTAATGARVVIHRLDWEFFSRPEMQAAARAEGFLPLTRADVQVADGHRLPLGTQTLQVIHTPGHTPGAICLYLPGHLFTGDTLFVGAAGRTDLPGGSLAQLLASLEAKIMPLPDDTRIWPGHDYGGQPSSTLAHEKATNPYLTDFF
jgi:hydroxyacylglutathione hydrolase